MKILRRAYETRAAAGDLDRAVTTAFWLWQALIMNREYARANGWVAQVHRLVRERFAQEGPAQERPQQALPAHVYPAVPIDNNGWLLVTDAYALIGLADYEAAVQLLARATEVASHQDQTDLVAFATTVWGRGLIKA